LRAGNCHATVSQIHPVVGAGSIPMKDDSFGAVFARSGLSLGAAAKECGVSERNLRRYVAGELDAPKLVREKMHTIAAERLTWEVSVQ